MLWFWSMYSAIEGSLLTVAIYISLHTAEIIKELSVFQDL